MLSAIALCAGRPFLMALRALAQRSLRRSLVDAGRASSSLILLYCDVIVRRWQDYTGKQALRDGQAFEDIEQQLIAA